MTKYILSRTLRSIFTVVVVFVCVFMLLRLMPLTGYFPEEMLKEADEATRMSYLRNQGLLITRWCSCGDSSRICSVVIWAEA